jgi:hypothetical protein
MSNGKGGLAEIAVAGVIALLVGNALYKEYQKENDIKKKKEMLKKPIRDFDSRKSLDPQIDLHRGLINTMDELREMLLASIDEMEKDLILAYPISVGMLMRSSIEQAIKVFIQKNGEEFVKKEYPRNEEKIIKMLSDKEDKVSQKLLADLKFLKEEKVRKTLNNVVHFPENLEKIEKKITELSTNTDLLSFVRDAAAHRL